MRNLTDSINQVHEPSDAYYHHHFENTCSQAASRGALFHTLLYLLFIKQQMGNREHSPIDPSHLRQIRNEDSSFYLSKIMVEVFASISADKHSQPITDSDIFQLVLQTFRTPIRRIIGLFMLDAVLRLTFSLLLYSLFSFVMLG